MRVSLLDIRISLCAVDEAHQRGRGAMERAARRYGVRRSVVMDALDRVESAIGGAFFVTKIRRTAVLTPSGSAFLRMAPDLVSAWERVVDATAVPSPIDPEEPVEATLELWRDVRRRTALTSTGPIQQPNCRDQSSFDGD